MKKFASLILGLVLISVLTFPSCNDDYENHALAFKNLTGDTITVIKYLGSQNPKNFTIAPGVYSKIYETSTDLWLGPPSELMKISDSIQVVVNEKTITFAEDYTTNSYTDPYSTNSLWSLVVESIDGSSGSGSSTESLYVHVFDISGN